MVTSDQQAQIEQLESHSEALRTDLNSALSKKPNNVFLIDAVGELEQLLASAKMGILLDDV